MRLVKWEGAGIRWGVPARDQLILAAPLWWSWGAAMHWRLQGTAKDWAVMETSSKGRRLMIDQATKNNKQNKQATANKTNEQNKSLTVGTKQREEGSDREEGSKREERRKGAEREHLPLDGMKRCS